MVKLKARLDSMKSELESEIRKAVDASEADFRAAQKKEGSLQNMLETQRTEVSRTDSNAILYNSLRIEVENMRDLLNSLTAKQNETLVSARLGGLRTSNIKIIDRALVPGGPFTPNTRNNLLMALLVGLIGGLGLVFFAEYLDNTVKGPEDAEKLTGLPSLGIIPFLEAEGSKKRRRDVRDLFLRGGERSGERGQAGGQRDRAHQPPLPEVLHLRGLPDGSDIHPVLQRRQPAQDDLLHEHPAAGREDGDGREHGRFVRPARREGPAHRLRPAQAPAP